MEPREALSSAAQIAVALAGIAGVAVAFRSSSLHEWSPLDKHRLWLLMSSALIPLFSCLFGMLLLTIKPVPISIWRWCAFPFAVAFIFFSRRRQPKIGPIPMKELGTYRYFLYLIASLSTVLSLLQAYNALIPGVFWLFYAYRVPISYGCFAICANDTAAAAHDAGLSFRGRNGAASLCK